MSIHIKTGDKWYTCASVHVNVSGTWHTCRQVYVKTGDAWHKCLLNTSTKTVTLTTPFATLHDYKVDLTNIKNGSTITITGIWKSPDAYANALLGIGPSHAVPQTSYSFRAEIDYKWYWFPKGTQPTTETNFTVKFTAKSTSDTFYCRAARNCVVKNCKISYTQEGYFD